MTIPRVAPLAVVLVVTAAACSSDSEPAETAGTAPPPTQATTATTTATTVAPTTSSEPLPTATTSAVTTTTLPGEPFDLFVPQDGEVLSVVAVAHDDVLNIREGPGVGFDIVGTLAPTADDVVGTGLGRRLDNSIWWQVMAFGTTGWVNSSFVSRTGQVVDLTFEAVDSLGAIPTATTMEELGLITAESLASVDPASDIVMSVAPTVGDLGEVTFDIVGFGDDSVSGYRLHIFADVTDDGFSLSSVEATVLCTRGVSPDGLCA